MTLPLVLAALGAGIGIVGLLIIILIVVLLVRLI